MIQEGQAEKGPEKTMGKVKKVSRFDHLIDYLKALRVSRFTGSIRIDFTQGGIGRVEKFEEILRKFD